ncbi:hypothetical protein [Canibacter zhoujuaniae]|uniref:hypothetical protein n=1 Tax=Canibacter zhoujuaniae TaxID=2708343 RepID=UPI00142479C1|nr:hypothetical protein [Canibacter zhoujuaniae]
MYTQTISKPNNKQKNKFKTLLVSLLAVCSIATSLMGVNAASAASGYSLWCMVRVGQPVKSGAKLSVSGGWGPCHDSDNRVAVLELHKQEGWWHPYVGGTSADAVFGNGGLSLSSCFPAQIGVAANYFAQIRLQNKTQIGDWVFSESKLGVKIGC